MKARDIRAEVFDLAETMLEGLNMQLVDVEYRKDHGNWYLTIFINREDGVGLDECEKVSNIIGEQLDLLELIPGKYFLEVSSPGVYRSFQSDREYGIFSGRQVKVKTYAPVYDKKEFVGELVGLEDDRVVLIEDGERVEIPKKMVAKTQLFTEI